MKVLIVSNGPVPETESSVVEGGGLRVWALAMGLISNGIEVKIAVPEGFASQDSELVAKYSSMQEVVQIGNEHDAVIYNYASGSNATYLFEGLRPGVMRISDSYVPIHIEVAARDSDDLQLETESFVRDSSYWIKSLQSADAYLVASDEQELYYTGLLAGVRRLTPANYKNVPIIQLPLGCPDNSTPIQRDADNSRLNLLWWGGFYPWFDWTSLIELSERLAIEMPQTTLLVAGARNPFVTHAAFIDPVNEAIAQLAEKSNVEILPWVEYSARKEVFDKADAVLLFNNHSPETKLSWRTRLVDAVEFGVPVISNFGDPFGKLILNKGAGLEVATDPASLAKSIKSNFTPDSLKSMRSNMALLQNELTWTKLAEPLAKLLKSEIDLRTIRGIYEDSSPKQSKEGHRFRFPSIDVKSTKIYVMLYNSPIRYIRWTKNHIKLFGFSSLFKKIGVKFFGEDLETANNASIMKEDIRPMVFVLHQLDRSGAPFVALDIIKDLAESKSRKLSVISGNPVDSTLKQQIMSLDIEVIVMNAAESIIPRLHGCDVFVNSSATARSWISDVLEYLNSDHIAMGYLFVHENEPEIFIDKQISKKILEQQKVNLSVYTPSAGTSQNLSYLHGLGIESAVQPLRVTKAQRLTTSAKTDSIETVLVGPTNDYRKRQLDVLLSVHKAQTNILNSKNPHRPITIKFIGIGNDATGNEIKRLADQLLLPGSFEIYNRLDKNKTLELIAESNVVVSLSSNESFGLYIAEAMTAGAIVLRTNVSGHKEMLKDSINGFTLDGTIEDLAEKLLYISDTTKFSNEEFDNFMKNSMSIIEPYTDVNYITMFESKTDF